MNTIERKFLDKILENTAIKQILDVCDRVNLPNWYLAAGAVCQTIWNSLHGFPVDKYIDDYDIIYFDPNKKSDHEREEAIKKALSHLNIEIVNEAFVHTWYKEYSGYDIEPYTSSENAMDTWAATASCIGIRKENSDYKIFAPFGVQDIFDRVIKKNPRTNVISKMFYKKAEKWKSRWPKLKVMDF